MALALVLFLGIVLSSRLAILSELPGIRYAIVATVLFLMALPVDARAMWQVLRRPWAPLLATVINFGLLPLFAWVISLGLHPELGLGLLIAATTPCTLASAAVWTRRAGGNDSVAILVTLITNALCFLITPAWLMLMIQKDSSIPVGDLVWKLGLLVVLPMTLAQLIRLRGPVAVWATRRKIPLGVIAQCGILSMIFLGSIKTGQILIDADREAIGLADYALMLVAVLGVHLVMLFLGLAIARLLCFPRADQIAVGISGSQKTLMVGLNNGMELGITILPMVIYHVGQLVLDTLIADRLRKTGDARVEAKTDKDPATSLERTSKSSA